MPIYGSSATGLAVKVNSTHTDSINQWIKIAEQTTGVDQFDTITSTLLVIVTGREIGANEDSDMSFILHIKFTYNGASHLSVGSYMTVEHIARRDNNMSTGDENFDPETCVYLTWDEKTEGGSDGIFNVWLKVPENKKDVYITHLGGSKEDLEHSDPGITICTGQSWAADKTTLHVGSDFFAEYPSKVLNRVTLAGNEIRASDGGTAITLDTSNNVTIGNDLKVSGNIIRASDGGTTITMDTSDNVTIGGDIEGENITAKAGGSATANVYIKANNGADAGDEWRLRASTSDTFAIGNDKAVADTHVDALTITGHATATSTNVATAGTLKVGANIIQASDGGTTITMDTNDNVTIGNDLTVGGGDIKGMTDGGLNLRADTNMKFFIDNDGGATGNNFLWYDDELERMRMDQETGVLRLGGISTCALGAHTKPGLIMDDSLDSGGIKVNYATLASELQPTKSSATDDWVKILEVTEAGANGKTQFGNFIINYSGWPETYSGSDRETVTMLVCVSFRGGAGASGHIGEGTYLQVVFLSGQAGSTMFNPTTDLKLVWENTPGGGYPAVWLKSGGERVQIFVTNLGTSPDTTMTKKGFAVCRPGHHDGNTAIVPRWLKPSGQHIWCTVAHTSTNTLRHSSSGNIDMRTLWAVGDLIGATVDGVENVRRVISVSEGTTAVEGENWGHESGWNGQTQYQFTRRIKGTNWLEEFAYIMDSGRGGVSLTRDTLNADTLNTDIVQSPHWVEARNIGGDTGMSADGFRLEGGELELKKINAPGTLRLQNDDQSLGTNNLLGRITFEAPHETNADYYEAVRIEAKAASSFHNSNNTNLIFYSGGTGPTERMKLDYNGHLWLTTSSQKFCGNVTGLSDWVSVTTYTHSAISQGTIRFLDTVATNGGYEVNASNGDIITVGVSGNNSTGYFSASVAGGYEISIHMLIHQDGGSGDLATSLTIKKSDSNGSNTENVWTATFSRDAYNDGFPASMTVMTQLTAGQRVWVELDSVAASNTRLMSGSTINIKRVSFGY